MASTKRLLKERANIARDPIPYVTFQGDDDDEDDGDDKMSDDAANGDTMNINRWRFVLSLDPIHDTLADSSEIGKASTSPYCNPPPSSTTSSSMLSSKGVAGAAAGLVASVTRAAKVSKKSSSPEKGTGSSSSSSSSSDTTSSNVAYFAFQLDFPPNYPFKPPSITVLGTTYHPNIKKTTGEMCDAVLTGEGWGPTLNVRKLCMRLRKFLCDPDPDHPLESDIAQILVEKPEEYAAVAYKHALEFATRGKAEDAMARGKQQGK
jgi:ubiquitin-protein ligase